VSSKAQCQDIHADVPTLFNLFRQFFIIGAVSFGGGIIAYERILLVDKKKWLSPDEFLAYLAISQTMPGLNSVNLAVLAGNHLRGLAGAIAATLGLIIPGSIFVLGVGIAYLQNADHPLASLILVGIAAGACGLLGAVTYRIAKDCVTSMKSISITVMTFVLMSLLHLPLVYVLMIMVPIAIYLYRPRGK
jgi:chromate transporter